MSKFAFEGDFKRKPEQKLGGRSIVESRTAVILKAQEERNKRERDRKRAAAILIIQAYARSYLSRQRSKNEWRRDFDHSLKTDSSIDAIGQQLKWINLFCNIKVDSERLHDLGKKILAQQEKVLAKLSADITWRVRMKRFLILGLQGVQSSRTLSRVYIRLIEVFTNLNHPGLKILSDNQRNNFVPDLWVEMVGTEAFFDKWRGLMEAQLELQRDYILNPLPFADSLVTILQKPLLLAMDLANSPSFGIAVKNKVMDSHEMSSFIIKQFLTSYTWPTFINNDPKLHLFFDFVIPRLRSTFPHQLLIDNLNSLSSFENPRHVIFTALTLVSDYVPSLAVDSEELESFMNIVQLSMQFVDIKFAPKAKFPASSSDEWDDDLDEDEMQVDEERDNRAAESVQIVEKLESIFNRCKDLENFFDQGDKSKWAKHCPIISRILHHYRLSAFSILRFLTNLSYRKPFVRSIYSRILRLGMTDPDEVISFCWIFLNSIVSLHDTEFIVHSPLSVHQMEELVNLLKNFYSESVLNDRDDAESSQSFINKTIVKVLSTLHERNTRLTLLPEEAFCSPELSAVLPLDSHLIRFDDFDSTTSTERLSAMDIKLMRLMTEFPFLLSFHNRVTVMHRLISIDRTHRFMPYDFNAHHIQIRRNYIYEDAFEKLSVENVPDLRGNVRISLVNVVGVMEAGVDGGGLLREFLTEATKAGVDPNRGLFRLDTQNRLYPNPIAKYVVPDYRKHFTLIGRLVGKALYEQTLLELPLAAFFLESCITGHVAGAVDYLATLDPGLHKNLLALKNYSDEDFNTLGLDFTMTTDRLGEAYTIELKPNGSSIAVSRSNVIEYIHLVADYKINRETAEMCRYFREGLASVCPVPRLFTWKELETLISGSDKPIDIEDWKSHTNYTGGYDANHPMIVHFWEVVAGFDEKSLRKLLKFVTSCSRPPLLGFKDLVPNFGIQSAGQTDRLPSAATCMNLLKLPEYSNPLVLREKLVYAIEAQAGFELS